MEHEIPFGKFQPGKRVHLFRFSTFSGNFPSETNRRNVFHFLPNRNFRKVWLNEKRPESQLFFENTEKILDSFFQKTKR